MHVLQIEHPIGDFDTWKGAFDRFSTKRQESGMLSATYLTRRVYLLLRYVDLHRRTKLAHLGECADRRVVAPVRPVQALLARLDLGRAVFPDVGVTVFSVVRGLRAKREEPGLH